MEKSKILTQIVLNPKIKIRGDSMVQVYTNAVFNGNHPQIVKSFLDERREELIGSAIFTQNNSATSKVVRWAEELKCKEGGFVPSHTGSIIEYKNDLYIFDMKPMRASVQPLLNYLIDTEDVYALVLRNFDIDTKMFSLNIAEHIGEFYPFLSAIRSAFSKWETKWRRHCSEMHLRELQKQGLFTELNPEITPDELYHILCKEKEHVTTSNA